MRLSFKKRSRLGDVDDYEDDQEESASIVLDRRRKPDDKDFKDLRSENRRSRKLLLKPWGRRERFIVLVPFVVLSLISAVLGLSSRRWKVGGFPAITPGSFKIPKFVSDRKIVMDEKNEDLKTAKKAKEEFLNLTSSLTGIYALSVVRLDNGFTYGVNEDTKITAASLIKLPVMVSVYVEAEKGFDLDQKYVLKNDDKVGGSGSLSRKPAGYEITYRNLISLMGKQSDNTAYNIVRRTLGDEKINALITKAGMASTSLSKNITTASDISRFFESLWKGNLISEKSKEEMLGYLTDTLFESWLAAGIPENIPFPHKYGREVHVVNDAGIVRGEHPFVMVVLSEGVIDKQADEVFPKIAKLIYEVEK